MDILRFDVTNHQGEFRILNATNGGPWHKRHADDQWRTNLEDYKAARFRYARNHDSAMCGVYGGPYSHDISCIFPNFELDPYDPASYDFACTDESILVALDADTETFFRLGQTIEHQIKKHATLPPTDFKKWAVICEHIIRHYNEGWADGYHLNIEYWEIWNEPDLDLYSENKRTWGGTPEQFFNMYAIAATHLKGCFPHLKIGGPALCGDFAWMDQFLASMKSRNVPVDFFSWHIYGTNPLQIAEMSAKVDSILAKYGYEDAESILNEWNYVRGWGEEYVYSLEAIHGMKGAAFVMAAMSVAAQTNIDMMMYYDTRPSVFNGCFDYYTYRPLKGYYPFLWYGKFYDGYKQIKASNSIENVYSLCGINEENKLMAIVTYYAEDDSLQNKKIAVDFGKNEAYEVYLLDEDHNAELLCETTSLQFDLKRNSCLLIKEK